MRDLLILLTSAIFFFLVFISVFLGIQNNIYRLPVYFLPNGQILNVNQQYKQFWGQKISIEDLELARGLNSKFNFDKHEVRIFKKNENSQLGNLFFVHIKKSELVRLFLIDIISSLIAFITAVLFFYFIRDNFIFIFFSALSGLIFANFIYLAFEQYYSVLIFFLYAIGFMIWNLSYRFRGKEIPTAWTIPQIILSGIMGFIVHTETGDNEIYVKIASGGLILIFLSTIVSLIWIIVDIFRSKNLLNITNRKLSLFFSLSILLFVPVTFLFDDPLGLLQYHRSLILIFFVFFLASFIFGTYKYSFVPMQVFFSPTTVTLLLVATILGMYAVLVYILNEYIQLQILSDSRYFNIFYLFVTIFYLAPLRNLFITFVNYWSFKKNPHLSKSLDKITSMISSPISVKSIVGTINKSMMESMNVSQIAILIPGDQFPNVDLKNINFTRISSNSDIWIYFRNLKEVTVTSHLAYGVGFREKLYSYLNKMEIQIAFPVRDSKKANRNKAILLIGEKINKKNFSLGELRYIREVARLASMLIDNYELLADEIEKKKIQRKIQIASILDHTLNLIDQNHSQKLRIGYFSIPAVEISGDYIDFINLNQDRTAIFLGDVSGHGLGTGYIVTAIKAIIRDLTQQDESIEFIFHAINDFLIRKYGGNEFMTLLGGILDTKKQTFTYVNAGHPGLIVIESDGNLKTFSKTQRVLGILTTDYKTQNLELHVGEKLVLYSDGVTETFDASDIMFGEDSLQDFLKTQSTLTAIELPILLQQKLDHFRSEKELSDDTSFIAIELLS